jgi:hypothetical protein
MSLTSYRAAPPRDGTASVRWVCMGRCEWVLDMCLHVARASMPGDDLLFHRLGFTAEFGMGSGGTPTL